VKQQGKLQEKVQTLFQAIAESERQEEKEHVGEDLPELGNAAQITKPGYHVQIGVKRMIEPESVFGQMKNNRGFRRFLLRGLPKVSLEVGWLSLAHNLLKKAAIDGKRTSGAGIASLTPPFTQSDKLGQISYRLLICSIWNATRKRKLSAIERRGRPVSFSHFSSL
jgi:hypothetical protein